MSDAAADGALPKAVVRESKRISIVWLIPIVAALSGGFLAWKAINERGPEITILFDSASGIAPEKTKIKYRDVEVGLVESMGLDDGLEEVVVTARMEKAAAPLLREDTQFWVVRARVGKGGLSGIGTLLSGAYIQLAPGNASGERLDFIGLEEPPPIPSGTPGRRITLVSDRNATLNAGDPLFYKGLKAG